MDELKERVETARRKLFAVRSKRIRPHKDDKILTDLERANDSCPGKRGAGI
ncbi:hypothetical protein [Candidatus Kuenenia stuttgartiensis]|uniref:hypothetical protein n=1 Tax=Kuenenia stuttgartiensis TaxID=174633 RepID=UPI00146D40E6|nr:hypothetical protein [Candidatus Kuenenia stuttgartiensis]